MTTGTPRPDEHLDPERAAAGAPDLSTPVAGGQHDGSTPLSDDTAATGEPASGGPRDLARMVSALGGHLRELERAVARQGASIVDETERVVVPAWRRVTQGEPRWPVSVAILVAVALQLALPLDFALGGRFLLPVLEVVLLVGIIIANPGRIERPNRPLRIATITLIGAISVANAWSAVRLIKALIHGQESNDATSLLGTGATIWATNVIVFALWYWTLDRKGPAVRRCAPELAPIPDFQFPQTQVPELVDTWEPAFVDYLYLSFTNATAFSPTDVLPLARWAKMTMMVQSAVSLVTVGLVIARAVNVLK